MSTTTIAPISVSAGDVLKTDLIELPIEEICAQL
jgi:hypothetical protein